MDPLDKITCRSMELATYARNAWCASKTDLSYEYLVELYNFLLDEIAGPVSNKFESTESPKGLNREL